MYVVELLHHVSGPGLQSKEIQTSKSSQGVLLTRYAIEPKTATSIIPGNRSNAHEITKRGS